MSSKVNNKKPKGTKQQPTDEPGEPLVRELFQDATPKSDKKKDRKRKRGVGESLSVSPKGIREPGKKRHFRSWLLHRAV
jgi:hypothetical protein